MFQHEGGLVFVEIDLLFVHFDEHCEGEGGGIHGGLDHLAALQQLQLGHDAPHLEGGAVELIEDAELVLVGTPAQHFQPGPLVLLQQAHQLLAPHLQPQDVDLLVALARPQLLLLLQVDHPEPPADVLDFAALERTQLRTD